MKTILKQKKKNLIKLQKKTKVKFVIKVRQSFKMQNFKMNSEKSFEVILTRMEQ